MSIKVSTCNNGTDKIINFCGIYPLILILRYDIPSSIPDGSIQSAGDNVLAFLRAVAKSPHLSNPTADDRYGRVVFTDILGLMMVVYPEWVAMVMNFVAVLLVALTFVRGIDWSNTKSSG